MITQLVQTFIRAYVKTGWRGATRVPGYLANCLPMLYEAEIRIADWPPIYMDLRQGSALDWFIGSPWKACPYERSEQGVMQRFVRPGMTVHDVGANVGVHAALLSHLVGPSGRVIMFEPNPALTSNLKRAARAMGNATMMSVALSDENRRCTFFVPDDHTCGSLFDWTGNIGLAETARPIEVTTARLETLVREGRVPSPQFMKVDAEAAETKIFMVARELLNSDAAPIILYEALHNFGRDTFSATRFLLSLPIPDYKVFRVLPDATLTPFDDQEGNLVAIPGRTTVPGSRDSA